MVAVADIGEGRLEVDGWTCPDRGVPADAQRTIEVLDVPGRLSSSLRWPASPPCRPGDTGRRALRAAPPARARRVGAPRARRHARTRRPARRGPGAGGSGWPRAGHPGPLGPCTGRRSGRAGRRHTCPRSGHPLALCPGETPQRRRGPCPASARAHHPERQRPGRGRPGTVGPPDVNPGDPNGLVLEDGGPGTPMRAPGGDAVVGLARRVGDAVVVPGRGARRHGLDVPRPQLLDHRQHAAVRDDARRARALADVAVTTPTPTTTRAGTSSPSNSGGITRWARPLCSAPPATPTATRPASCRRAVAGHRRHGRRLFYVLDRLAERRRRPAAHPLQVNDGAVPGHRPARRRLSRALVAAGLLQRYASTVVVVGRALRRYQASAGTQRHPGRQAAGAMVGEPDELARHAPRSSRAASRSRSCRYPRPTWPCSTSRVTPIAASPSCSACRRSLPWGLPSGGDSMTYSNTSCSGSSTTTGGGLAQAESRPRRQCALAVGAPAGHRRRGEPRRVRVARPARACPDMADPRRPRGAHARAGRGSGSGSPSPARAPAIVSRLTQPRC